MDKYAAALPGCPRLGAKRMRGLIEYFHTAEDAWKASDEDIRNPMCSMEMEKPLFFHGAMKQILSRLWRK